MSLTPLVSCEHISKAYGVQPLFTNVSLGLFEGDRVGLVGPNGSGKTTLLKILAGTEPPDAGTRSQRKLLRLGYVPQDPDFPDQGTVETVLAGALALERADDFAIAGRIAATLGRAGLADPHAPLAGLSAGWRKRLAIACELVRAPDLLLLDEPTNHLDVEGILWLEELLLSAVPAHLVVSHDRYFLERVATRILELHRAYPDGLFDAPGPYSEFLLRREAFLQGQATYEQTLASKVRREVEWLRRGPKARTRKASARVAAATRLIRELDEVRERSAAGSIGIELNASERKSTKLLVVRDLRKRMGDRPVIDGIDLTLTPGTRLGILGSSGSGKSTLLGLLAGTIEPDSGLIERAEGLRAIRFDQTREGLDLSISLRRALAPEGDMVIFRGRAIHVVSWAKRFLFRPEQLEVAVSRLSGGERARILIARLMLQPADVLLLDEPTNDLDIPTLEVLEENLADFPGALVLVTRDRFLMSRVATRILVLDGTGRGTFFADYGQWETAKTETDQAGRDNHLPETEPFSTAKPAGGQGEDGKRLTYLEKREWERMEETILAAEQRLAACHQAVEDPAVASDPIALEERWRSLEAARADVDRLYARWAELENKQR
jgi:ATP-binding cassette subfamily F protein uup